MIVIKEQSEKVKVKVGQMEEDLLTGKYLQQLVNINIKYLSLLKCLFKGALVNEMFQDLIEKCLKK